MEIGTNHTSPQAGFVPDEKRWLVERNFAWLGDYWRLSIDRERTIAHSCTMVPLAFIRLGSVDKRSLQAGLDVIQR
ncbi:hypothetical protein B8X00_14085, partial [Acetobacter fabarum]